jgi:hypothetical protein
MLFESFIPGTGNIFVVHGNMNSELYKEVIDDVLIPQLTDWFPYRNYKQRGSGERQNPNSRHFTYMHDYAPAHTSKRSKDLLASLAVPMLDWPANSPDMNPIENCWSLLKRLVPEEFKKMKKDAQKAAAKVSDKEVHREAIVKVWASEAMKEMAKKCIDSMPRRIEALKKSKGGWTGY